MNPSDRIICASKIARAFWRFAPFVALLGISLPVWANAGDLRFGAQTHFAQGWDPAWAAIAAGGGLATVRDELYWSSVETTRGTFAFPKTFDTYMAALASAGVSPLIELDFANPNYDGGNTPWDADGIAGYTNYCAQVLQHYGSQIQAVEIWNEYDGSFCAGPAAQNRPASYQKLLQPAYAQIKSARPDVTVAAGSTSWTDLAFFQGLFAAGGLASLDVLSIHPYNYSSPPEGLENDIAALRTLTRIYNSGQAKPIWVTEIGWYPHISTGLSDPTITDIVEAQYVVRSYSLFLSAGVGRVYWYLLRDNPEIDNGLDLGLFPENASSPPKPAFVALTTMMKQLAGAQFVRREGAPTSFYSMLFQRADQTPVRVLWATSPVAIFAAGATTAVDMLGHSLSLTDPLTIGGSPIFVTGPVTGLPNQNGIVLADSLRDYGPTQSGNGWQYGSLAAGVFLPAPTFQRRDTAAPQWTAAYPWFSITPSDQLPSATGPQGNVPVSAVRRWTSSYSGRVEITGRFATEQTGGDGVGVSVSLNGNLAFRKLLGGGRTTIETFDVTETVSVGTTIDFAVDPGPAADNSFDATAFAATITTKP